MYIKNKIKNFIKNKIKNFTFQISSILVVSPPVKKVAIFVSCEFIILKYNVTWIHPLHHCSTILERKLMRNLMSLTCLLRWRRRLIAISNLEMYEFQ